MPKEESDDVFVKQSLALNNDSVKNQYSLRSDSQLWQESDFKNTQTALEENSIEVYIWYLQRNTFLRQDRQRI